MGGGGKRWVRSLEFQPWRFIHTHREREREREREKKSNTKEGGGGCLEKRKLGLGYWGTCGKEREREKIEG